MIVISLAFGLTAFIYALSGFAGGSTYLGLLTWWGVPFTAIPQIALCCNIIVSTGNSIRYARAGLVLPRLLVPHMLLAIPFAYVGGAMNIGKETFLWLTACSLLLASLHILFAHKQYNEETLYTPPPLWIAIPAGGVLGFLSGLIGIGGGIFLAPLLYTLKAGSPREIASTCSFFILVNSLAGLAGQIQKLGSTNLLQPYWPMLFAVLIGGQLGSHMTVKILKLRYIALFTGLLLLATACRLWWQIKL